MSKMSELDLLVQELKKCGESLVNIADELAGFFSEAGEKKEEAPAEPAKEYTFTESLKRTGRTSCPRWIKGNTRR